MRLQGRAERAQNWAPAFERAHGVFLAAEATQFGTGRGWTPALPVTLARKRRAGLDTRTLHATGRLARSLTSPGGEHLWHVTSDGAEFGTTVPYAKYLKRQGRNPIAASRNQRAEWRRILAEHLMGGGR